MRKLVRRYVEARAIDRQLGAKYARTPERMAGAFGWSIVWIDPARSFWIATISLACGIAGCRAEVPIGRFACNDGVCPPGQACDPQRKLCVSPEERARVRGDNVRRLGAAGSGDAAMSVDAIVVEDAAVRLEAVDAATDRTGPALIDASDPPKPESAIAPDSGPAAVVCPKGFERVLPAMTCRDIDECQTNNGGCDPRVRCTHVNGLPQCGVCPRGFNDVLGDGTRCFEIDACAGTTSDADGCDAGVEAAVRQRHSPERHGQTIAS